MAPGPPSRLLSARAGTPRAPTSPHIRARARTLERTQAKNGDGELRLADQLVTGEYELVLPGAANASASIAKDSGSENLRVTAQAGYVTTVLDTSKWIGDRHTQVAFVPPETAADGTTIYNFAVWLNKKAPFVLCVSLIQGATIPEVTRATRGRRRPADDA